MAKLIYSNINKLWNLEKKEKQIFIIVNSIYANFLILKLEKMWFSLQFMGLQGNKL